MVSVKQIVPGYRLRGGRIWLCLGGTSGGHMEPLYFISEWAMAWKTTTNIATNNPSQVFWKLIQKQHPSCRKGGWHFYSGSGLFLWKKYLIGNDANEFSNYITDTV